MVRLATALVVHMYIPILWPSSVVCHVCKVVDSYAYISLQVLIIDCNVSESDTNAIRVMVPLAITSHLYYAELLYIRQPCNS